MKKHKLDTFTGNWIIGDFTPSLLKIEDIEVGIKKYLRGETNPEHYHKVAKEFSVILDGVVEMNGEIFHQGDIIEVEQNEKVLFRSLTDSFLLVVKTPSVPGDKYLV